MIWKQFFSRLAITGGTMVLLGGILAAQEVPRFTFAVGGGFTQTVGNTGRHLDDGWNIMAGGGINFSRYVGAMVDVGYNRFGINSVTLNNAGFPGGNVSVFSATLDPIVHLNPGHHVDVYAIGGGGFFRLNQEFTQPGVATVTGFDPFFGFYNFGVPTTEILSSYSVNKPGIDVGAGFAVGTRFHGKLFAEARYDRIFMSNDRHVDYIPVSFGLRW
jgi:Outer membrane protein beta-barrel domain